MPSFANCWARPGFSSVFTFASRTVPFWSFTTCSSSGASARHGPHHGAQKSTTTGVVADRSTTSVMKVSSVTSTTHFAFAMSAPDEFLGDFRDVLALEAGDGEFVRGRLPRAVAARERAGPVRRAAGDLVHVRQFRARVRHA